MIQNYNPGGYTTVVDYELVFDDGYNNGFAFPCDESGHLLPSATDAAAENYLWCMAHPDDFVRWNRILCHKRKYRENASGVCSCGKRIQLWNEYAGACECPNCGQWYNLFGQELLRPEAWSE